MADHGPFCKMLNNDKEKILKINHVEETENVKWCVLKSLGVDLSSDIKIDF